MKSLITIGLVALALTLSGCQNFSPRQRQDINNQDGKIGEIENLANSMKAELGNLKSQAEITDSQLEKIQQGLANIQSNNENSGVQILSGPGGLMIGVVAILAAVCIALMYRREWKVQERTADMLTQLVVSKNDPDLEEAVFRAAMYTDMEENVLTLVKKHKRP